MISSFVPRRICVLFAMLSLAACAPAPILRTPSAPIRLVDAVMDADHWRGSDVVWGGEVVEVRNRADVSEIVIVAFPLDDGQRPQRGGESLGRFIAVLPGYVESFDYPEGRHVTVAGKLDGHRDDLIGEQHYDFAVVRVDETHLWPVDFDERKWHVGIGISGGIR